MPAFIGALLVGLASVLSGWVFQLLISLGVGFVTFTGVTLVFESLHGAAMALIPSSMVGILGLMRVDQAFNLVLSACVARLTLQGLSGGGVRKMIFKPR